MHHRVPCVYSHARTHDQAQAELKAAQDLEARKAQHDATGKRRQ